MNITFIKVVIVFLTIFLMSCGGAEERKAAYLSKARASMDIKNYEKARIDLKNVLQIDPKDSESRYLLGQIYEIKSEWAKAFGMYRQVVDLEPMHVAAREKLGRIYLLSNHVDEAKEQITAIREFEPENKHALLLEAAVFLKEDEAEQALQISYALMVDDKNYLDAIALTAEINKRIGKIDEAERVLNEGIKNNPDYIVFRHKLVEMYQGIKEYEKAETVLKEMISIDKDDLRARISLVRLYIIWDKKDAAVKIMREISLAAPDNDDRQLLFVDYLLKYKSVKEAESELKDAIKRIPDSRKLRLALGLIYEKIKVYDKAEKVYQDFLNEESEGKYALEAMKKLASLEFKRGNIELSSSYVNKLLESNPGDYDAMHLKGKIALKNENYEDAVNTLRVVLRDNPTSGDVALMLAGAHLKLKEPDLAKDILFNAVDVNPSHVRVAIAYSTLLATQKDYEGAHRVLKKFKTGKKPYSRVLEQEAKILLMQGRQNKAMVKLALLREYYPKNLYGYDVPSRLLERNGEMEESRNMLEQGYNSTKSPKLLKRLVQNYVADKKTDELIIRLKKELVEYPDYALLHDFIAEVYAKTSEFNLAEKHWKLASVHEPKWELPYDGLARIRLIKGDLQGAREIYSDAIIKTDSTMLRLGLANLLEKERSFDKAKELYERVLEHQPKNTIAINNIVSIISDHINTPENIEYASVLMNRIDSNHPAIIDTRGWLYFRAGEYDKSLALLQESVKSNPDNVEFNYHLGMVLIKLGDKSKAEEYLTRAVKSEKSFTGIDDARKALKEIKGKVDL